VVDFKVGGWHRLLDLSKAKISGFLNSTYLAAHFSPKANYFLKNTLSQPHFEVLSIGKAMGTKRIIEQNVVKVILAKSLPFLILARINITKATTTRLRQGYNKPQSLQQPAYAKATAGKQYT